MYAFLDLRWAYYTTPNESLTVCFIYLESTALTGPTEMNPLSLHLWRCGQSMLSLEIGVTLVKFFFMKTLLWLQILYSSCTHTGRFFRARQFCTYPSKNCSIMFLHEGISNVQLFILNSGRWRNADDS
jgi:hypothetical protein